MDDTTDRRFFFLCEDCLSDIEFFKEYKLKKRQKLIFYLIRNFGVMGIIAAYTIMVLRKTTINLPIFRNTAILDIKANLILRKPTISDEYGYLPMQRRHLPTLRIIRELIKAHAEYRLCLKKSRLGEGRLSANSRGSTEFTTICTRIQNIKWAAASNRLYLLWLLHFYIHRSIIFANSRQILSNVKSVVTVEEYTAQISGYLSALFDLGLPLSLFLGISKPQSKFRFTSLSMFSQIIARNGIDADSVRGQCHIPVYLEKKQNQIINFNPTIAPKIGLFLSSYYTMNNKQVIQWTLKCVIPFIIKLQKEWGALSVVVYCHPNDIRPKHLLVKSSIQVCAHNATKEKRMLDYDIIFCGNTSVVEEALNDGVPVVYTGAIDPYSYDVYEYVKNRLVPDATYSLPTRAEVQIFYHSQETQNALLKYSSGINQHEVIDLVNAICQPHGVVNNHLDS